MQPPRGRTGPPGHGPPGGAPSGGGPASAAPKPPPRTLREGWLKCRTEPEDNPASDYEDFWCTLDSDGVLSLYRSASSAGGGSYSACCVLPLHEAILEEHPGSAPGDRGLAHLGWALRVRHRGGGGGGRAEAGGVQLRAASVRERAIWLAALTPHLGLGNQRRAQLFSFMDGAGEGEDKGLAFRSLPRALGGASRPLSVATSGSMRWRGSLVPQQQQQQQQQQGAGRSGTAASALKRRGSLRELVRRAAGDLKQLSWTRLPEVVSCHEADRLSEAQQLLECLRFSLVTSEVTYNGELGDLVTLARRSVSWHDPLPVFNRRTIASVVAKVKKLSDNTIADMEQSWQKRLIFDSLFVILQKHMEKFDVFISYCSHLHELRNIISGAKINKTEVSTQAFSKLYNLERVYLPLLRLTAIRKILQEMRGVLVATSSHLDHFHCKRALAQVTEILEECYKVLTAASSSTVVSSLDKTLEECCSSSTLVSFPEVFKKSTKSPSASSSRLSSEEKEQKPRSSLQERQTPKARMTAMSVPIKSSENVSKSAVSALRTNFVKEKSLDVKVVSEEEQTHPKKKRISNQRTMPPTVAGNSVNRKTVPNISLSSKNKTEKHLFINPKKISIVDIPLHDNVTSEHNKDSIRNNIGNPGADSSICRSNINQRSERAVSVECERRKSEQNKGDSKMNSLHILVADEEGNSGSDHSGSSNGTLNEISRHNSSSEGTIQDEDSSNQGTSEYELCDVTRSHTCRDSSTSSVGSDSTLIASNESIEVYDYPIHRGSPSYLVNELYSPTSQHSGSEKDCLAENNYDYVYVLENNSNKVPVSDIDNLSEPPSSLEYIPGRKVFLESEQNDQNSSGYQIDDSYTDENIYEYVQYVDMNPSSPSRGLERGGSHGFDSDPSNDIYDDVCAYVKPDTVSLRSSSERSRYSSDSGTLEDGSNIYYNSAHSTNGCHASSPLPPRPPHLQNDDLCDEYDSAIESGSDTGKRQKVKRTSSNASLCLQNMVRWKNTQSVHTPSPLAPRKSVPLSPIDSPFQDAPLYQEYYMIPPQKIHEREDSKTSLEEDKYICVEPQEHEYETLDDYLLSRDMVPVADTFKHGKNIIKPDNRRTQWCETEEVLERGLLAEMRVEERRLQEAKFEIITSEVSFLKSLNILEKYFINNVDLNSKEALSLEDRRTLFLPIVPVKETSQCFLQDLVKVWEDNIILENTQLAEVMCNYSQRRFRTYIAYCSRLVDINEALSQLREKNKKFKEIIEKIEEKSVCQAFTLQSFVTQPMQRITRFPMLVQAIIRHLPKNDESFDLWKKVLLTLQNVVQECNEAARNAERTLEQKKEEKKKSFWAVFQSRR